MGGTHDRWVAVGPSRGSAAPAAREGAAESWTTQQLAEFLSAVSSFTDEADALQGGVEHAAEAIDAELAVLVLDGAVDASIGFPANAVRVEELVALTRELRFERELPGLGLCT